MNNIDKIISEYIETVENRKALEKKEKEYKTLLEMFNNGKNFATNTHAVYFEKRKRETLDTKTLYQDFPDIKKRILSHNRIFNCSCNRKSRRKNSLTRY